ncbi:MAG: hypothetical protein ACK4NW_02075 [Roseinatronobacter sp.]
MTDIVVLDRLIASVEAGSVMDWGYASGYPRIALQDNWKLGFEAFTGSLDSFLLLKESLLPEWRARLDIGRRNRCWMIGPNNQKLDAYAETPARAGLLAILRAYRSQVTA